MNWYIRKVVLDSDLSLTKFIDKITTFEDSNFVWDFCQIFYKY